MEWVERLSGKVVGLDTAPLIYFIEDHPTYAQQLATFFEAVDRQRIRVVTSVVALVEVLVRPLRERQSDLVKRYKEILLGSAGFDTLPVSAEIAEQAARLRATHGLRTPDAVQLATAMSASAAAFLTNDARLAKTARRLRPRELELLVLTQLHDACLQFQDLQGVCWQIWRRVEWSAKW